MARPSAKATTAAPSAKRRKGFLAVALPWLKRFGVAISILIILIWLGAWLVVTGTAARMLDWSRAQIIGATAQAGFTVENLLVEGRVHTDPALLKALLNIQTGDPLLGISPQESKALLEDTKWIRSAYIQRRLPDTLYIKLQERIPIARQNTNDQTVLIDERGQAIPVKDAAPFSELLLIKGKDAAQATPAFITMLNAEPTLKSRATSATRMGQRRWDLTLRGGITLKLPEDENLGHALRRAAKAQAQDKIFDNPDLESLDLRFDDKIIIRTKPGAVIDYRSGLSDNGQSKNNREGSA